MAEEKKKFEGMASIALLIPQLSYDIIARLIPGWALLFTGLFVFTSSDKFFEIIKYFIHDIDANKVSFIIMFLLFVSLNLLAYMIASSVSALVFWISRSVPLKGIIRRIKHNQIVNSQKIILKQIDKCYKDTLKQKELPEYPLIFDSIRICFPDAGARLTKTRAEYHMSRTLVLGFALMVLIILIQEFVNDQVFTGPWIRVIFVYLFALVVVHATRNDLIEIYGKSIKRPKRGKIRKKIRRFCYEIVYLKPGRASLVVIVSICLIIFLFIYPTPLLSNPTCPLAQTFFLSFLAVVFAYYGFTRRRRLVEGIYNHWVIARYEIPACAKLSHDLDNEANN